MEEQGITGLEPVGGGATAWAYGNENWIVQRRSIGTKPKLEAISAWAKEARKENVLLSGTEITVIAEDEISFWSISPRLNTLSLEARFREMTEWDRFKVSWPSMIETMRVVEELADRLPPPRYVVRPPNNAGTVIRNAPVEIRRKLIAVEGVDLGRIRNMPEDVPESRVGVFHGDLTFRNMIDTGAGYLAVDWEMVTFSPLLVELGHSISWHLIWEKNPDK